MIVVCDDEEAFGEQICSIIWKVPDELQEKTKVVIFTVGEGYGDHRIFNQ